MGGCLPLALVLGLIAILAMVGLVTLLQSASSLEVTDIKWVTSQYGTRSVQGVVHNHAKTAYGYVQVQINLYDAHGTQVGSTMANVNNLEAGTEWRFEAPVLQDAATNAKVKSVTGF